VVEFRSEADRSRFYRRRPCLLVSTVSNIGARNGDELGRIALVAELVAERPNWKRDGSCVVLAHGAFDLLHPGHIRLLEQARALGDVLVVAVESDANIRVANAAEGARLSDAEQKSVEVITPAAERAEILAALAAVDFVIELNSISLADLAERLRPDVLVRGGAASATDSASQDSRAEGIVTRAGGKVTAIPLEPGYSTASLMGRIRQLRA
jgi:rfaE bifunctional protein nucleotidyltransferase chain/domain